MHMHTLLVWSALGGKIASLGAAMPNVAKAATVRVERMNFMMDFLVVLVCVM